MKNKKNFKIEYNLGKYSKKGLNKEEHPFYGKKHSKKTKEKMSENHADFSGEKSPMFGKPRSKETKDKIIKTKLGSKASEETKKKMSIKFSGEGNPFYGKHHTQETKDKIGLKNTGKKRSVEQINKYKELFKGEKNPNWKGGKSFEPYVKGWGSELKRVIRQRDNFTCQICFEIEREEEKAFDVHHIDYNKKNLEPKNLITLCKRCHSKTNSNRNFWEGYFKNKMFIRENIK